MNFRQFIVHHSSLIVRVATRGGTIPHGNLMNARTADSKPRPSIAGLFGLLLLRLCELLLLCAIGGGVAGIAVYRHYSRDLPDPANLAAYRPFETTRIYARDGQTLLYEVFGDGQRTVVTLDQVPAVVKAATVAVEDANFYTNPGVDIRGIVRALWLNRQGTIMSGGSTITQQLARIVLLEPDERAQQSYGRKIREAILALRLSRQYSKDQILQFYLNEVYYGNMAYGIEEAARSYFGKPATELQLGEAALLAGLVQSPTDLNPFANPEGAKRRQRIVLEQMVKTGAATRAEADSALAAPLLLKPRRSDLAAAHFVFYVLDLLEQEYGAELLRGGGLRVVTTLDPRVQGLAESIVAQNIAQLRARDANNAAVVAIDPRSGEILGMVGSADYGNQEIDGEVNVATSPRQPGSALKPLVYAAAMMRGWTPATIIWDVPLEVDGYRPENYDRSFHGPQRLRLALANSFNIPAVKALQFVGVDALLDLAHDMGISTLQQRDHYGLAVALGAGEVTLLDLTNAYATFANAGRARPPSALLRVAGNNGEVLFTYQPPQGEQVLGPNGEAIAFLVSDMLSDNTARTPMFGADSVMRLAGDRPAAVKTGTSNDYKDSLAVGYTPQLALGVWVGNTDAAPMQEIAGANGAGLIWRDLMERVHEGVEAAPFVRPATIEEAAICLPTGVVVDGCPETIAERFVIGSVPRSSDQVVTVTVGGDGSCLATDATPLEQRRSATFLLVPKGADDWQATGAPARPCTATASLGGSAAAAADVVAAIDTPAAGTVVGRGVSVKGSAAGRYALSWGAGDAPQRWITISSGQGPIVNGLLGAWNTAGLKTGIYTLQLEVSLPGSPATAVRRTVRVDQEQLSVQLVLPAPDSRVAPGASMQLAAQAGGPAARIEFIVDGAVVGVVDGDKATFTWTSPAPGRHTIEAVAVDAEGAAARSAPVSVVVE